MQFIHSTASSQTPLYVICSYCCIQGNQANIYNSVQVKTKIKKGKDPVLLLFYDMFTKLSNADVSVSQTLIFHFVCT